jgi:hypothetical protein
MGHSVFKSHKKKRRVRRTDQSSEHDLFSGVVTAINRLRETGARQLVCLLPFCNDCLLADVTSPEYHSRYTAVCVSGCHYLICNKKYALRCSVMRDIAQPSKRPAMPTVTKTENIVGFEVLTAVITKMVVFWVVAPCSLVEVATTQKTAISENIVKFKI